MKLTVKRMEKREVEKADGTEFIWYIATLIGDDDDEVKMKSNKTFDFKPGDEINVSTTSTQKSLR